MWCELGFCPNWPYSPDLSFVFIEMKVFRHKFNSKTTFFPFYLCHIDYVVNFTKILAAVPKSLVS